MKAVKMWLAAWWTWNRPIRWWEAVLLIGAMIWLAVDSDRKSNAAQARKQRSHDACVAECAPLRYVADIWDGNEHVGICIDEQLEGYLAVRCGQ